jgi:hypothetical protein
MKHQKLKIRHNRVQRLVRTGLALGLLLSFVVTVAVYAQVGGDYDLSWGTIDNGGKYSAGGPFWLGGTIGQPDAGSLSGGDFELTGGFWHIKAQYGSTTGNRGQPSHCFWSSRKAWEGRPRRLGKMGGLGTL